MTVIVVVVAQRYLLGSGISSAALLWRTSQGARTIAAQTGPGCLQKDTVPQDLSNGGVMMARATKIWFPYRTAGVPI